MKQIHDSNFATVYYDEVNNQIIKVCDFGGAAKLTREERRAFFEYELEVMSTLKQPKQHPNIVEMRSFYFTSNDQQFVMMYAYGGLDLSKLHALLTVREYQTAVLPQLVDALAFLHSKRVVHGDLKLENVLFDRNTQRLRLCDFGLSRFAYDFEWYLAEFAPLVTGFARPPELFDEKHKWNNQYSTAVDVWSLGVCLWTLWHGGVTPFGRVSEKYVRQSIEKLRQKQNHFRCPLYRHTLECNYQKRARSAIELQPFAKTAPLITTNTQLDAYNETLPEYLFQNGEKQCLVCCGGGDDDDAHVFDGWW